MNGVLYNQLATKFMFSVKVWHYATDYSQFLLVVWALVFSRIVSKSVWQEEAHVVCLGTVSVSVTVAATPGLCEESPRKASPSQQSHPTNC